MNAKNASPATRALGSNMLDSARATVVLPAPGGPVTTISSATPPIMSRSLVRFAAMRGSPGARTSYLALRARGTGHQAPLRQLANQLVGILHGFLKPTAPTTNTPPGHSTTAAA